MAAIVEVCREKWKKVASPLPSLLTNLPCKVQAAELKLSVTVYVAKGGNRQSQPHLSWLFENMSKWMEFR